MQIKSGTRPTFSQLARIRSKEFISFVATGAIAAIVNAVVRYVLNFFIMFEAAVVIAYLIGMVVAFLLFRGIIFKSSTSKTPRQVFRFCVVNAVGIVLAFCVSSLMARVVLPQIGWLFHPFEVAHMVGIAVPAFSSYFGHKFYTFR